MQVQALYWKDSKVDVYVVDMDASGLQLIIKTSNGKVRFANPWKQGMDHHDPDPRRQARAKAVLEVITK
jgi:hypothetical protein